MSLFGSHERYLGVDIANSAVKIVEIENNKGRPKLVTYGYLEQANEILTADTKEARDRVVQAIMRIQEAARFTSHNVISALPSYTVFTSIIHLPKMPKKELMAAVQWEAKKFVPMPLEEMILDWKILEETSSQPGATTSAAQPQAPVNPTLQTAPSTPGTPTIHSKETTTYLKILLTAAPKNLVSRYIDIFKQAKLNLVSLETESFALERSLIGNDTAPIMLIDIGASATTISIVKAAVPLINRSIDIGGRTITKAIANSMNIDIERAEQFKRDFGLTQNQTTPNQVPSRVEFMVNSIINEIRYVMNLYQSEGNVGLEKIILTGGSAWLPNMTSYFSQALGLKVFIGDPWARVMYPVELKPVLQNLGPRFAVSVGLAMREIH